MKTIEILKFEVKKFSSHLFTICNRIHTFKILSGFHFTPLRVYILRKMTNIRLEIKKTGNSYAFRIPKGLITAGLIDISKKSYDIELKTT